MTEKMEEVLIIGMKQQFFKLGSETVKGANTDGSGKLWLGRMAAGIANLSFACELSLKHLYYKETSETIFGHELLGLYEKLSSSIQLDIKNSYVALCKSKLNNLDRKVSFYVGEMPKNLNQDVCNFDDEIKKYTLSFVNYRYYFEPQKTDVADETDKVTKYYQFDYRFLYLFFLTINKLISDDTYGQHENYYENLQTMI